MIIYNQIETADLIHLTIDVNLKLDIFMCTLFLRDVIPLVTIYFCFTHVQIDQFPPCLLFLCYLIWPALVGEQRYF